MEGLDVIWLKKNTSEQALIGELTWVGTHVHSGSRLWWMRRDHTAGQKPDLIQKQKISTATCFARDRKPGSRPVVPAGLACP